jgi:hypothetical protein
MQYIDSNVCPSVDCVYPGGRLLGDTTPLVDQQARDYVGTLQKLRRSLSDHASISAAARIYRVLGTVEAIGRANRSCHSFSQLIKHLFCRGLSTSKRGSVCGESI